MEYLNDETGEYEDAATHFGYTVEHDTEHQATWYDMLAHLDIDDEDALTDDAKDAIDEWFRAVTELDYENGNRYWLELDDDREKGLFDRLGGRIYGTKEE